MWQFLTLMNYILKYKLKKCLLRSNMSKSNSKPKNNTFQFYEYEKTYKKKLQRQISNFSIFIVTKNIF